MYLIGIYDGYIFYLAVGTCAAIREYMYVFSTCSSPQNRERLSEIRIKLFLYL